MILYLPFWILSICISLFEKNPEVHPHIAQAEQASMMDLKPLTTESLSVPAKNVANETGT